MDSPEAPVTTVTFCSGARQRARSRLNLRRRDSGPANPFGDLVELFAAEHLVFPKEFRHLIEEGSQVDRLLAQLVRRGVASVAALVLVRCP